MSVQTAVDDDPVAPKTYDWRRFKRLLAYLRPYLGAAAAALGLIVVMAGLDLVGPWLTKVAIDSHIAVGVQPCQQNGTFDLGTCHRHFITNATHI